MATQKSSKVDIGNVSAVCRMCGTGYGKMNGYFYKSQAQLYKGVGYLPYCKRCVDYLFENYVAKTGSTRDAVRQVCRKLDLYWDETIFNAVEKNTTARNAMSAYLSKVVTYKYSGRSYDDTLEKAGLLWDFVDAREAELKRLQEEKEQRIEAEIAALEAEKEEAERIKAEQEPVSEDIKLNWGSGLTDDMYRELEHRFQYWVDKLTSEGVDVTKFGTQALLRQIVQAELDINKGRASGENVDKKVALYQGLLGDAMLKPSQAKDDSGNDLDKTPFGVWIRRWEDQRPVPEPDPELQDTDGIIKYLSIWFFGHLCKLFNIRNSYCKLYEDKIAELRVDRPEFDDEDDESFFNSIFNDEGGDESG